MHNSYTDIRERALPAEPQWWDERAVPRYCAFAPNEVADIYSDEAALVEIQCQACQHVFLVAFSSSSIQRMNDYLQAKGVGREMAIEEMERFRISVNVAALHYGDPPNIGCCPSGPTMNCDDIRVIEFWSKERFDWKRRPELEVVLADAVVAEEDA